MLISGRVERSRVDDMYVGLGLLYRHLHHQQHNAVAIVVHAMQPWHLDGIWIGSRWDLDGIQVVSRWDLDGVLDGI